MYHQTDEMSTSPGDRVWSQPETHLPQERTDSHTGYPAEFTVEIFNELGFMDLNDPPLLVSNLTNPIHPIFARRYFTEEGGDVGLWDSCEQAFRLASAFLQSPASSIILHAMINEPREKLVDLVGEFPYDLYHFCNWRRPRAGRVQDQLHQLEGIVRFAWHEDDDDGETVAVFSGLTINGGPAHLYMGPAGSAGGLVSKVSLRKVYATIIQSKQREAQYYHDDARLLKRILPRLLRAQFYLALTICHELCHAIYFATMTEGERGDIEPFYCDDRLNEFGNVWEMAVFGGRVSTINTYLRGPLYFYKWPDFQRTMEEHDQFERRQPKRYYNCYFLAMNWINKIQRQAFWDAVPPTTAYLRYPKSAGWRETYQGADYDPNWNSQDSSDGWVRPNSKGQINYP